MSRGAYRADPRTVESTGGLSFNDPVLSIIGGCEIRRTVGDRSGSSHSSAGAGNCQRSLPSPHLAESGCPPTLDPVQHGADPSQALFESLPVTPTNV
jgi:hypothetical protein